MVAQVILDHLVWVRALVPEPMAPWSSGKDVALSRRNHEFDSRWRYQTDSKPSDLGQRVFILE